MSENRSRLKVLLVPDSVHWVTGTIAKSIARFNRWIEPTIASGPVIDLIFAEHPELMRNFDLVHFTCPYASREWLPRFRDQVPCITSHHHVTDWELIKHNVDGDAIIVGSPEWSEDLRQRGADVSKVFWVPYGVDAEKFRPPNLTERATVRTKLGISSDAIVIGFFGKNSSNDDDRKGIDVLTRAAIDLSRGLPNVVVLIIGPGWQHLVETLKASGVNCRWLSYVEALDGLVPMYHALDFYWVTARVEGGPVPLLEAMSSEVCCLTTSVGLAREVAKDGENSVVLPFNDADAFVNATLRLADDPNECKRLGRNARQTILREMHTGVVATRVGRVYEHAFENFAKRLGKEDAQPFRLPAVSNSRSKDGRETVPLNGFPGSLHKRIAMLEDLAWSEHLVMYHNQRRVAAGMIITQWLRNPLSIQPPRVLLRRFLPSSVVATVVNLKNRGNLGVRKGTLSPPVVR